MMKKASSAVMTLLVVAIALWAFAPFADAATGKNGVCEVPEVCVYKHSGLVTPKLDFLTSDSDWSNDKYFKTTQSVNDSVSSIDSFDVCNWYFFKNAGYKDFKLKLYAGDTVYSLASGTNDELSSGRFLC